MGLVDTEVICKKRERVVTKGVVRVNEVGCGSVEGGEGHRREKGIAPSPTSPLFCAHSTPALSVHMDDVGNRECRNWEGRTLPMLHHRVGAQDRGKSGKKGATPICAQRSKGMGPIPTPRPCPRIAGGQENG